MPTSFLDMMNAAREQSGVYQGMSPEAAAQDKAMQSLYYNLMNNPSYVMTPQDFEARFQRPYAGEDLAALSSGIRTQNQQDVTNESTGSQGFFNQSFAPLATAALIGGGMIGLGGATGGVTNASAGAGGTTLGDASLGGFYGGIGEGAGTGGLSYTGQGLSSVFQSGVGGDSGGMTQLASDAGGDPIAWGGANEDFPSPTYDTDTGQAPGGLAGFLGGISPNTWATLGGQLLNTGAGLYAQNKAVDAQTSAANNAAALQAQMYAQNRADLAPWREAGVGALGSLTSQMPEFTRRFGMSDYTQDPGYQFRLSEGEKGINRAAAARGLFDSGGTMKALGAYNSNMASQEYGNAYNRFTQDQNNAYNKLSNLAGMGQTTAQQVANMGANYAGAAGDLGLQAANARASGYIGGANTVANAVNQGLTSYNQMSMLPYLRGYLGP